MKVISKSITTLHKKPKIVITPIRLILLSGLNLVSHSHFINYGLYTEITFEMSNLYPLRSLCLLLSKVNRPLSLEAKDN
jgi:hypothetical protein